MTLGNVSIEQHEYQRAEKADGTYETATIDDQTSYVLEAFEQGKPLLPIVGDPSLSGNGYAGWDDTTVRMSQVGSHGGMQVFAGKNAQDKFVVVENNGKSDAYVRTLVAVEVGSGDSDLIGRSYHQTWTENEVGIVKIDNNNYYVIEYVYAGGKLDNGTWRHKDGILPAGETAYPNLSQVYLKSVATNEDMVAIDGNGNGQLDILVLSQAGQVAGFEEGGAASALDTMFGEATPANAAVWFGDMEIPDLVNTVADMETALDNGGVIEMVKDIHKTESDVTGLAFVNDGNTVVINGEGNELKAGSAGDYSNITRNGGSTTYNDVEIVSAGGGVAAADGADVTFNSGSVYVDTASTSGRYIFYAVGEGTVININGGSFSWDPADNQKRAYIYANDGTTVNVNGGEFGKASTRSGYTAGILGPGTVIIKGGTFGFDPSAWVADGYKAVKADGKWTVSAVQ